MEHSKEVLEDALGKMEQLEDMRLTCPFCGTRHVDGYGRNVSRGNCELVGSNHPKRKWGYRWVFITH